MKRYAAIYGFLAVFFTTFTSALPIENAFEGSLRFNVSFTGGDMEDRAQVAMMVPESYKL